MELNNATTTIATTASSTDTSTSITSANPSTIGQGHEATEGGRVIIELD